MSISLQATTPESVGSVLPDADPRRWRTLALLSVAELLGMSLWFAASAVAPQPRPEQPVFVTVKPDLSIAVGEDVIVRDALPATLDTATKGQKDERIYLRADKAVSYGDVMEVMNLLRNAGYLKIALVGLDGRT